MHQQHRRHQRPRPCLVRTLLRPRRRGTSSLACANGVDGRAPTLICTGMRSAGWNGAPTHGGDEAAELCLLHFLARHGNPRGWARWRGGRAPSHLPAASMPAASHAVRLAIPTLASRASRRHARQSRVGVGRLPRAPPTAVGGPNSLLTSRAARDRTELATGLSRLCAGVGC